ncbi:MAG: hypothetical protein II766_00335 [Paludibacteraceae bacterium]|nr:hypothetical protein [Paludibacteraceae bacterium]
MTEETYIALIQKDIRELSLIAEGLNETGFPTPTVIRLASDKAVDIVNNLQRLSEYKQQREATIAEEEERKRQQLIAEEEQRRIAEEEERKRQLIAEEEQRRIAEEEEKKRQQLIAEEEQRRIAEEEERKRQQLIAEEEQRRIAEEEERKRQQLIAEEEQRRIAEEEERKRQQLIAEQEKQKQTPHSTSSHTQKTLIDRTEIRPTKTESVIGTRETKVERIISQNKKALADRMANTKIESLRKAISMGDRFRFQRELFDNNAETMNAAIDSIDACSDIYAAEDFINDHFDWDPENETVRDFLILLSRRF